MGTCSASDQVNDLRTLVSDIELGGDDSRFTIEFAASPDHSAHEIRFVEPMAFHIGIDVEHIKDITASAGYLNKSTPPPGSTSPGATANPGSDDTDQ